MPLLHVTDRPDDLDTAIGWQRSGLGAVASGASHLAMAILILAVLRMAPAGVVQDSVVALDTGRLIWVPSAIDGGGRTGGGDGSTTPARRVQNTGSNSVTVPSAPTPSTTTATTEPPPEMPTINARPMGDATQMLAGAIGSDSVSTTLGRNSGGGTGDGDGPHPGAGRGVGDGIGDVARPGSPGVTTPIALQQVRPQYTADAMRAKVQGSVWLECVVLPDGNVGSVRVTRSLDQHFGLDAAAIAAARRWRFKPGTMNGTPVPVVVSIELTFSLR